MDENLANSEREAFEAQAPSLYTGSGRGEQKKGRVKGILKKKGPMAFIIGLIFGVGGLVGGAQLMQPFSLVEQFRETFNSMQTSTRVRSSSFMRYQMDTTRVKDPIKGRIFSEDTFKITKSQAQKLAAQGITYDDDYEGTGVRVLKFDDGSGQIKIVTAEASTASRLGGDAIDFDTLYKTNADFYNGYNKGSMTWRGAIANWFDTLTVKFLQSNKITRNLFQDFQRKVEAENEGNSKKVALELMAKGADEITEGGQRVAGMEEEETYKTTDSEGNEVTRTTWEDMNLQNVDPSSSGSKSSSEYRTTNETTVGSGKTSRASLSTSEGVRTKLNDIAGNVQKGANIACTVFNVLGSVGMLVTASEALQVISLATSYFEAIDKVKAGDGADSPIHDLTNSLNEKKTNTNTVLTSVSMSGDNITGSSSNVTTEKSAMEASGITALYGGGAVNAKDPSVQSFNFSGSMNKILGGLGSSLAMFEACGVAKIAANATSAITDAVTITGCILGAVGAVFTFGVSATACSGLVAKVATGVALSVAIGVAVAGVISVITPTVASMLTRDLITNIGGEDLGNALTSGANMYMGNTHRANGGSLANREKYVQFAVAQQAVIADNAKYERQNRDPFDATSKYTFMGTLMNQVIKLASVSSVMSAVTSVSSTVSSSIIAMSPTVSAYDIVEDLPDEETFKETCPYLWSIGAVGDAYCNPYAITDMSTIDMDPADVIETINNFDSNAFLDEETSDGNVKINGNSDLAKYILYCDNRTSSFGMTDWNIVNAVSNWGQVDTGVAFVNSATNSAIGAIPIIGDVIDVVGNSEALANVGYVSGESCVAGNTVDKASSPNWEKAKYYQRFIEDQSLAETIGLFGENGKSAVTAFLDEYYEENPLDNSYEGILARYSGLTKDDVIALLDFIDYSVYVANYNPGERYAFGSDVVKIDGPEAILFTDENEEKFYNVWWYNNIYDRVGRAEKTAKRAEYTIC